MGGRELHPVPAAEEPATGEHDQVAPRLERHRRDFLEMRLGRRLDDEARGVDEVVEGEERDGEAEALQEALGLLAVARGRAGKPETRDPVVEGAAERPADGAEADDADVHDRRMVSCRVVG